MTRENEWILFAYEIINNNLTEIISYTKLIHLNSNLWHKLNKKKCFPGKMGGNVQAIF